VLNAQPLLNSREMHYGNYKDNWEQHILILSSLCSSFREVWTPKSDEVHLIRVLSLKGEMCAKLLQEATG
jgi:hypothetical protein